MDKIKYNKETKLFSLPDIKSYIDKYCKVIEGKNSLMPESPCVEIIMDDCYITSGVSIDKIIEDGGGILEFLRYHGITQVDSSFPRDEYHKYPVANIGYNPDNQKWYGWSHRAWNLFGIGDIPKELYPDKTVTGKKIETLEEAKQAAINFANSVA